LGEKGADAVRYREPEAVCGLQGPAEELSRLLAVSRLLSLQVEQGEALLGEDQIVGRAEPLKDRHLLEFPRLDRLFDPSQAVQGLCDPTEAEGELSPVPQDLERGDLFLKDLQGLLVLSSKVKDLGDLAARDGRGPRLSDPLVDRQLLGLSDSQGGVEVPLIVEDVGDGSQGDSSRSDVPGRFEDGENLVAQDSQRFLETLLETQELGDLKEGDRALPRLTALLVNRKLLLPGPHGFIEGPAYLQSIADQSQGHRDFVFVAEP
jgi:hypothetical protein